MKVLTAAEMREVDRLTSERYAIPSLQLMETAGSRVAEACCHAMDRASAEPRRIAVLCGKGNNGGDGFVAARHLQSPGTKVTLYLFSEPRDLHGDAATIFTAGPRSAITSLPSPTKPLGKQLGRKSPTPMSSSTPSSAPAFAEPRVASSRKQSRPSIANRKMPRLFGPL